MAATPIEANAPKPPHVPFVSVAEARSRMGEAASTPEPAPSVPLTSVSAIEPVVLLPSVYEIEPPLGALESVFSWYWLTALSELLLLTVTLTSWSPESEALQV